MEEKSESKDNKVYYVGTSGYSYRSGEPAVITGIETVFIEGKEPRACYKIEYADGMKDSCPISDSANYKILLPSEVTLAYKDVSTP
jgi:hypothetical protein